MSVNGADPADLFARMTAPEALREGFARIRRNRSGPGGDGETPEAFARDLDGNIARLCAELRDGRYRPGPLTRYPIPKPDGRKRWLAVPSLRDRIAQGAAAEVLGAHLDGGFSDASFAYRPGRSVEHAAGRVTTWRLKGFVHVVDGDIADFFDSVPHRVVIDRLRRRVPFAVRRLVGLWLASFGQRRWFRARRGLAQGSPLSPVLANLVLDPIDHALESRRVKLVRYADDFLLMARTAEAAAAARARMEAELKAIGLSLHAGKTRLARLDDGIAFLGLTFTADTVSRETGGREAGGGEAGGA